MIAPSKSTEVLHTQALNSLKATSSFIEDITQALAKAYSDNGKVNIAKMDQNQLAFYQLAWITAEQKIAENFLQYAWDASKNTGDLEKKMAVVFAAETVSHIRSEISARPKDFAVTVDRNLHTIAEVKTSPEAGSHINYFATRLEVKNAVVLPLVPPKIPLQLGKIKTVHSADWLAALDV